MKNRLYQPRGARSLVASFGILILVGASCADEAENEGVAEIEDVGESSSEISERWQSRPWFTPPFHIAADGYGDLGARFVDVNGDGRADLVYHRWINAGVQQKGAYINMP